jgi:F420-0:gamma-glutamyl ligase
MRDLFGRVLRIGNIAVVDGIAAGGLLMDQGKERRPVAIFKGLADVGAEWEEH